MKKINTTLIVFAALLSLAAVFPANAQRRDYLTEAEIELVRDNQEVDARVRILMKAVDRRLAVLNNQTPKEKSDWGEPPKGTPTELFLDIEKLLQKAIEDVDEVAVRNKDSKLFPKAVNHFADKCREYLPQFKTFYDKADNEKMRGALLGSSEKCSEVIEASSKVPKEEKKKN